MSEEKNNISSDLSLKEQTEYKERQRVISLSGMYENWFLDYASYVILERAVPELLDGLKPVHRRILHAMKEMDDGRLNKVANIIGQSMKYHPHGDAAIGDALVQLGQKNLLIDIQGNWGNILTGDSAAAPRYIEARLSKFAHDVVFNPKITKWTTSYDGRSKEPVCFPVKFPLLLALGAEGIAVGLSSKLLPHNFNELIDASVKILTGQDFEIYPDFPTGGLIDVSKYANSSRGGRVRIRAKINKVDNKTLMLTEIPYGINTTPLIESIIKANDSGKVKIKKIEDNTAENVEILLQIPTDVGLDQTIDALYAFTNCEISVSPNACVIHDRKPQFLDVKTILKISTQNTLNLLSQELEIQKAELSEQHLFLSLERIFIEEKIYRDIEECETWESVISTIDKGLASHKKKFYREITKEDIVKLTEIKIKRISKFDGFKADEIILSIKDDIKELENHLANPIDYAIAFFKRIKQKFGKDRERKTEIRNFDTIEATTVAVANEKLYINREEGFAGTGLRKDEYITDCSSIDDIIVFRDDGTYTVFKIADKVFVGENIIHIDVFKKNDDRTIYNVIYRNGASGPFMVKRFAVTGIIRDKEYNLTKGEAQSKVIYFSANPNGEAELLDIFLSPKPRLKKLQLKFNFSDIAIKGRDSIGNILTKNLIKKVKVKDIAETTISGQKIFFNPETKRLNNDGRGTFLGEFYKNNTIIAFMSSGKYCIYTISMNIHFEDDLIYLSKYDEKNTFAAIYFNKTADSYYLKRFNTESIADKMIDFINANRGNTLVKFIDSDDAEITITFKKSKDIRIRKESKTIIMSGFIGVKSYKAKGKRITDLPIKNITFTKIETQKSETQETEEVRKETSVAEAAATKQPIAEVQTKKAVGSSSGSSSNQESKTKNHEPATTTEEQSNAENLPEEKNDEPKKKNFTNFEQMSLFEV